MGIFYGSAPEPKPDMQSQTNPPLSVPAETPQVQSTENTPPTLSPAELDRMFGQA